MDPLVGAVHDRFIGPLEVERVDEGLAQALVLELLAPGVEVPALRTGRRLVGNYVTLDASVLERRKFVARRPDARGELLAKEIILGGEAFERDIAVPIIFEAHGVEIVLADEDRQLRAPPVLHAFEFDVTPDLEAGDLVRTRA